MNERSFRNAGEMNETIIPRGEQSRTAILQAAHDLFLQQGYHGTSMRQIARDAHLALGGLYNHFNSKEDVFEAVFLAFHPYHEVFPFILSAHGDNLEQVVKDAIQRMVEAVLEHPDYLNLMFIEIVEFKSVHAQRLIANLLPQGVQILQHLFQPFSEQIRPIPSPMVARTLMGVFLGYFMTEIALSQGAPMEFRENAIQYFVDIYLHGILNDKE